MLTAEGSLSQSLPHVRATALCGLSSALPVARCANACTFLYRCDGSRSRDGVRDDVPIRPYKPPLSLSSPAWSRPQCIPRMCLCVRVLAAESVTLCCCLASRLRFVFLWPLAFLLPARAPEESERGRRRRGLTSASPISSRQRCASWSPDYACSRDEAKTRSRYTLLRACPRRRTHFLLPGVSRPTSHTRA